MFFSGLIVGVIIGLLVGVGAAIGAARRNTKECTPSASHNSQSTKSHWQWLPVGSGFDPTKEHDGIEIKRR